MITSLISILQFLSNAMPENFYSSSIFGFNTGFFLLRVVNKIAYIVPKIFHWFQTAFWNTGIRDRRFYHIFSINYVIKSKLQFLMTRLISRFCIGTEMVADWTQRNSSRDLSQNKGPGDRKLNQAYPPDSGN